MLRRDLIEKSIRAHSDWLGTFSDARVKKYRERLGADFEASAAEAMISEFFRTQVDEIEPGEDMARGGPDLRCVQKGKPFCVEVTSLKRKSVGDAIWIPDDGSWEGGPVDSISRIVRTCVSSKVKQCLAPNVPTLIAIGTHHSQLHIDRSLAEDLLISDVAYEVPIRRGDGERSQRGRFVTRLRNALFMQIKENRVEQARSSVAGVIIFGLGRVPFQVIGVLNSDAHRVFDATLLSQVPFATTEASSEGFAIRWVDPSEHEQP